MYFKGKVVGDARYVHKDAIELIDPSEAKTIQSAIEYIDKNQDWNVVKIELKQTKKISFLDYENLIQVYHNYPNAFATHQEFLQMQ